jgi:2-methylisocitrate lyase-like PEP mutase family enzyme
VISAQGHAAKLRAEAAARHNPETFIIARTDALAPLGLDEAMRRAELYLNNGADGIYIEAVETDEQLEKVGERFRGVPLATSILEGGGRTPWKDLADFHAMGYTAVSDDGHLPRGPRHPEGGRGPQGRSPDAPGRRLHVRAV